MIICDPADFGWLEGWGSEEPTGRDRREAERVVAYWQNKLVGLGDEVTVAALDLGSSSSRDWSNRFLIAVDRVFERSSLLLYGRKFARLLHLPEQARPDVPMLRKLPQRYVEVFRRGCARALAETTPAWLEGEIERYGGRLEQYRAVFIPIGSTPHSPTCFAFGAFNSRIIEPATAA